MLTGGATNGDKGFFVQPTVVTEVGQEDEIVQKEVFGPVVTVQRFADDDEALAWANDVEYGLSASVWTRDIGRALNAARKLQFGTVWINDHIPLVSEMPHGGYKQSGYGKDLSVVLARGLHADQTRDGEDRLMASDAAAAPGAIEGAPGDKGLKADALGFVSSVVIGVASTAPGYSLAASLGLVVAAVGLQSPAIMWISFIPMLLVATAYYYLNRVDPDCGTTFSWATKAFGPWVGWIGGWGIIVADVIVMANLADIAGRYTFLLFGADSAADSKYWVMLLGVIWIAVMTWICYIGIEVSAKTQWFLLAAEILALFLFAVVALVKVYVDPPDGSVRPSLNWLNPFDIPSTSALTAGLLVAIFIYWGWDSLVSVNEETEDKERTPGIAAVTSTILLLVIYVSVSFAAQAYAGTQFLIDNSDDVLSALGTQVLGWGALHPDHRGAHIGLRLDPDDDSPHHAHIALDGGEPGDSAVLRAHPPAPPDPQHVDDLDGCPLDRLVRRTDCRQPEHPLRLDRCARPDDRLLLRALRLRVHLVLPPELEEREGRPARRHRAPRRRADLDLGVRRSRASTSRTRRTRSRATPGSGSARRS